MPPTPGLIRAKQTERLVAALILADPKVRAALATCSSVASHRVIPTVAEYLPVVERAAKPSLTSAQYPELDAVTRSCEDDPLLDTLLLRFHTETGARGGGGAIALTLADLDASNSQVRLHERGGKVRLRPLSPTLVAALQQHALAHGATKPSDQVFRYRVRGNQRVGAGLTRRRYNTLADR